MLSGRGSAIASLATTVNKIGKDFPEGILDYNTGPDGPTVASEVYIK